MDHSKEKTYDDKVASSVDSEPIARPAFYDPSKESRLTRLGLNFESFKRAPGVTGYVDVLLCNWLADMYEF